MADFLRMVTGLLLLPACWAATRTLADAIVAAAGSSDGLNAGSLALLGGIVAFAVGWVLLPHPVPVTAELFPVTVDGLAFPRMVCKWNHVTCPCFSA